MCSLKLFTYLKFPWWSVSTILIFGLCLNCLAFLARSGQDTPCFVKSIATCSFSLQTKHCPCRLCFVHTSRFRYALSFLTLGFRNHWLSHFVLHSCLLHSPPEIHHLSILKLRCKPIQESVYVPHQQAFVVMQLDKQNF
jgi:hypothetical protein